MRFRQTADTIPRLVREEAEVVFAFVTTRLLVCGLAWLAYHWIKHGKYQVLPSTLPWNLLYHWDALWYGRIVQRGYDYARGAQSSVNFFPLFPLLVRGFRWLTDAWTPFAGFVISNGALLGAGILLRRLAALDYPGSRIPPRAVWLLFLCPATFFHSAGYAESLFILLSLGGLLLARNGQWVGVGLTGALLTATRGNALLIMIPLAWEARRRNNMRPNKSLGSKVRQSRWWLAMAPLGVIAYAAYLYVRFGDALAFARSQSAFYREFGWPWAGLMPAFSDPFPNGALQLGAAAVGMFLCWLMYRVRMRASYQLYAIAMLLLTLSTSYLTATPRLVCEIFPFYLALAVATSGSRAWYLLALALSACLMAVSLALFVCGYVMV